MAGKDGAVSVLNQVTLEILCTMSVSGRSVPGGTGPVVTRTERMRLKAEKARKPYVRPTSETLGRAAGVYRMLIWPTQAKRQELITSPLGSPLALEVSSIKQESKPVL